MTPTSRTLLALALGAALVGSACDIKVGDDGISVDVASGRAVDEWVKTYPISANGTLEIVNANGQIEAEPASGREIEVRIERTARGSSDDEAQALLQTVTIDEQVSPDRVRIEGKVAGRDGGLRSMARRNGVALRYFVRVPAGLNLRLETSNGGIELEDLNAKVDATTTNGGITGEGLSGGISAKSVNGGIRLEMVQVTSDIDVAITNGGIRLELPADVKATLDATTINGGVNVDDDLVLQSTEVSRRRVAGTFNGGGPKITASSVNGGVRIDARGRSDRRSD